MVWEQLSIDKPHVAYIIIGGFTSLFMLCSLLIKEKLYIGEATVATLCGVIFGPHAANLFDPGSWGNTDKITLELSRIVLVVQCFAVGVELPKSYMERHWKSVTFLLLPVMTSGWLITSLAIWALIDPLSWLESLAIAACVTATDPVLASSVVGKGKFAKRVPKHLRDVLSAESGCNDGMAFPFIYLSLYLIRYHLGAQEVVFHWVVLTILYECIFGAVYGFLIGYIGRHAIKYADRNQLIDRESFLVFYFVLALFCAGTGSLLGLDDLLVGFSAGVGFSNDGWFTQKTEEAHVSNVIDLLLNLSYFVYLGSIIPWDQFSAPELGLEPWRLVVIAIMVILLRRIPAMLALKPIIPDIKNWREALFAGHFGPIGVGAIFAAILTRAELETDSTQPLAVLPEPGTENYLLVKVIWPVVSFLVLTSIVVHGSSIAVFTLGKRINTLTLTMSYTQANESSWMDRLPRIASKSGSVSKSRGYESAESSDEKLPQFPPGTLPPVGFPGNFLRRQKEEDNPSRAGSRSSSLRASKRRRRHSAGGPISQSAITPQWRARDKSPDLVGENGGEEEGPDAVETQDSIRKREEKEEQEPSCAGSADVEAYQEGNEMIVEDEEGNTLDEENVQGLSEDEKGEHIEEVRRQLERETSGEHAKHKHEPHRRNEGEEHERTIARRFRRHFSDHAMRRKEKQPRVIPERHRGPAHAYQYGNTIIVEDEAGEVVKKYVIPTADRPKRDTSGIGHRDVRRGLMRMGTWKHMGGNDSAGGGHEKVPAEVNPAGRGESDDPDEQHIRFSIVHGGRRMSKADFIKQIQSLDPKARCEAVDESDAPANINWAVRAHTKAQRELEKYTKVPSSKQDDRKASTDSSHAPEQGPVRLEVQRANSSDEEENKLVLVDSHGRRVPVHDVSDTISKHSAGQHETAAQRRRRLARGTQSNEASVERISRPLDLRIQSSSSQATDAEEEQETNAERKRRLAALGQGDAVASDSDEDGGERRPKRGREPIQEPRRPDASSPTSPRLGIRFAEGTAGMRGRAR